MHSIKNLRGEYDKNLNAYLAAGEPAIFHCHHYNCYLQAVIQDTSEYLPLVDNILKDSAQEIVYHQLKNHFSGDDYDTDARKKIAEDYYSFAGFGKIHLSGLNKDGGVMITEHDHYGQGWKIKFGKSEKPVSLFTSGFLAGALEAVYDLSPGTLDAEQDKCIAMGHTTSSFTIRKCLNPKKLEISQGKGVSSPRELKNSDSSNIDYDAVRNAITSIPIEGDEKNGLINAFGVMLTRHYANYYTNVSNRFINYFCKELGIESIENARVLLIEAGHVCAFNTFGGVMQSNEWNALIKPMCKKKEDWIHGIVAVVNGFGWGFWEVEELTPDQKLRIRIYNGYESNSYLKKFGQSKYPVSYLAQGGTAGLMNLVYVLNIPENNPVTLDEGLYKEVHDSPSGKFISNQLKCRAMGDDFDLFEVTRSK